MKTAREILLGRYRRVEPRLDQLHAGVLSAALPGAPPVAARSSTVRKLVEGMRSAWLELLWRPRRIWAGFAITWVAIVIFNAADARQARVAAMQSSSVPAEVLLAWERRQEFFGDFTAQHPDRQRAKPAPRPRAGQRQISYRG